jgi:hypothetical protein
VDGEAVRTAYYVPPDDPRQEPYYGYQYDWSTSTWQTVWESYLTPGETAWWGVNPNPAWVSTPQDGTTFPWESTFFAQLGLGDSALTNDTTELDLATNWTVCGGQGQLACPGGGCANETSLTDVGGYCVPIVNKVLSCDNKSTMNLNGTWSLTIANNGAWGFLGSIEATGGLTTNYFAGLSLSATNASGQEYAYGQSGTVADNGWLYPSSNTFSETGIDPTVPGRWTEIESASVNCLVSGSANIGDDVLQILTGLGVGAAAVGPVLLSGLLRTQAGPNQTCTTPEPGVTRCEFGN